MRKRILVIAVVLLVAPLALALDPLGPPTAGLRQGQVSLGLDYAKSQTDIKVKEEGYGKWTERDSVSTKTYANLGYGVCDSWEVFGRLGGSMAEGEYLIYEGRYGMAWGLGTKVSFYQDANVKWGALFQISWNQSKEQWYEGGDEYGYDKVKFYEYQIAVGPTYKLTDKVSIYGGPFYNCLDGEVSCDEDGKWGDIKNPRRIGGYIGGQFAVNDNLVLNAEYQLSSDESGMGLQLVWKF